jgi:hypothetical protein
VSYGQVDDQSLDYAGTIHHQVNGHSWDQYWSWYSNPSVLHVAGEQGAALGAGACGELSLRMAVAREVQRSYCLLKYNGDTPPRDNVRIVTIMIMMTMMMRMMMAVVVVMFTSTILSIPRGAEELLPSQVQRRYAAEG